jgi:hypothetical protein
VVTVVVSRFTEPLPAGHLKDVFGPERGARADGGRPVSETVSEAGSAVESGIEIETGVGSGAESDAGTETEPKSGED